LERLSYTDIHNQIIDIKKKFSDAGEVINKQSYLGKLLNNTLLNFNDTNSPYEVFDALSVDRIYSALLNLDNNNSNDYLKHLLKGTLDFRDINPSHAKNILFELEVIGSIKKVFTEAYLGEPDIVVPFKDGDVGIACKKVVSKKNLKKQLSQGVKQIQKNNFKFGIVAINIDNILPEKKLLEASSREYALDVLHERNMTFIEEYDRFFLKYLNDSRLMALLIVSSTIADVKSASPRYYNISQSTIWTLENLEVSHKAKINKFKKLSYL